MEEAFNRQRRNLLLTSMVVLLVSFAGIEIDNQLILLGTKFKVTDPIIIYMFLWFMLAYFFIRYIQYFLDLSLEHKAYAASIEQYNTYASDYKKRFSDYMRDFIDQSIYLVRLFLSFLLHSIFRKNFSETLFPIIFAVLVTVLSFNTPFVKEKQGKAFEKLNNLFIINSKK